MNLEEMSRPRGPPYNALGGLLLTVFVVFHLFHFTGGLVASNRAEFEHLMVYQNVVAGFSVWPISLFYIVLWERSACTSITASGACPDARLGHGS